MERIVTIVDDLDLKDGRFGAPAGTGGMLIDGPQLATAADDRLLTRGITLFESLYRAFAQTACPSGPRQVAKPRPPASQARPAPASSRRRSR